VSGSAVPAGAVHAVQPAACRRRDVGARVSVRLFRVRSPARYVCGGSVNSGQRAAGSGQAIQVRDVHKVYRKDSRRKQFATLKSALLSGGIVRDLKPDTVFEALKGVSFDVAQGKTFGIVGRNGSGKSTMLKMIAGIGKPTSGTVRVNGRVSAL